MSTQPHPPLAAVAEFFETLNAQGIRYCHWKSNCFLDRSMSGLTDLDILVDPAHEESFRLILRQHDVKAVISPPDRRYPAVEDYLGLDRDTGRLFHLHVHYQLVLGEQFVKNYRLPLEQAFLDSVQTRRELVKIPSPELELIVLGIRALLKYRDRDVVKDVLTVRSPGLPPNIMREFEYLLDQTDWGRISGVLKSQVGGIVSPYIILELLTAVINSPRSGLVLFRLRRHLRRDLAAYQFHSRGWASAKYFRVLLRRRLSLGRRLNSKKTPARGGLVVAVVGADGSGKSTIVSQLRQWLSWKLDVRSCYMGSQEPSLLSRLLAVHMRIARKFHRAWSGFVGEGRASSKALWWFQRLSRNLYHLSTGRDRYRRSISARRLAARGTIVICDRYPLAAVHQVMEGPPMDGPRIAAEAGDEMDEVTGVLSRLEHSTYRRIQLPDHIFVLHVSPDVSQQRKPDHGREMIEAKSSALKQMDSQGLHATEVDADQPFERVLLQVKRSLWQLL